MCGPEHCEIDANGCVTDGAEDHGDNEACAIEVLRDGVLSSVGVFSTEADSAYHYDYLTINGQPYSGNTGPGNVAVTAGSTFTWQSDHSTTNDGWTVCWAPGA